MSELLYSLGLGAAAVIGVTTRAVVSPRSRIFGPVIYRGQTASADGAARVAITFDDGPHETFTPAILDELARLEVKAAFFVIGLKARRFPQLLRRADAEGHLIAGHSYDHHYLGSVRGLRYWRRQLDLTDAAIADAIGTKPAFFRPPIGLKGLALTVVLQQRRLSMVTWTRRAHDGVPTTCPRILARLLPHAAAGDILVLHDSADPYRTHDVAPTIAALPELIAGLRQRGLQPVRLDELINRPGYQTAAV